MSKSTFGWRQAGFTAVATALVFGGTLVGAGAATAVSGQLSPGSAPGVIQGANNQAAGNLTYEFLNSFTTNTTVTLTPRVNDCTTAAGIAAALEFASAPTATLTGPTTGLGSTTAGSSTSTKPAFTVTLGSSSTQCITAGIQDVVTITLTTPSVGVATNAFKFALTNVAYNVGTTTPTGDVTVVAASTLGGDSAINADVVDKDFSFIPRAAATPNSSNNALGTATYTETTAGAYFKPGVVSTVAVSLSVGTFTTGVTPTITAPAGYTVTKGATDGTDPYTFTVAAPATAVKAVVTVAGLRTDAPATVQVVNLDSLVTSTGFSAQDSAKALNVVNYGNSNRIGGNTRYETAAALFNAGPGVGNVDPNGVAVLSGGELFPDALSANYLASSFGTGTLLTKSKTLSPAARNAIIDNDVRKVYITGGTAAVSQAIQDQIESMHVGGFPFESLITTVRLGGDTRYDTNKVINNFVESRNGNPTPTVLLSSGENFPDALAFGPIAYANQSPLVLTKGASLSAQASSQLAAFDPDDVVISGQTDAVSTGVATSVNTTGATVSRLGGDNRSETATMIATWATEGLPDSEAPVGSILRDAQGFDSTTVNFTWTGTAQGFGDALAAGPLAGSEGSVILLASTSTTPGDAVTGYLGLKDVGVTAGGTNVGLLRALGGTDVTSSTLMKASAVSIEK